MSETEELPNKNPRITAASMIGSDVAAHYAEMSICDELSPNEAFAIQAQGFSLKLLRELADDRSTGKKAFVVFEHTDAGCFEVRRLPDGQNPKRYYGAVDLWPKQAVPEAHDKHDLHVGSEEQALQLSRLIETIEELFERPVEESMKYFPGYCEDMRLNRIIPYTYIHRKLSSVAVFRKSKDGPTANLKKGLAELVKMRYVKEVPKGFSKTYGTEAAMYQWIKD